MNDDPQDVFRQMDAMISRMFFEMTREMMAGLPPHAIGYRIIIRNGGAKPDGKPQCNTVQPRGQNEPVPEVHRIGDEVKVVTELPGIEKESIHIEVEGSMLSINADTTGRHYQTSVELPPVNAASMQTSLKNGVLEVTFAARPEKP